MSSINFLPPSFFQAARSRRRRAVEVVIVAAVGLLMVGGYFLLSMDVQKVREELASFPDTALTAPVDPAEQARLSKVKSSLVARLDTFREMASPIAATQILAALSQLQDGSIGLTELVIDGKLPTPKAKEEDKVKAKGRSRRGATVGPEPEFIIIRITGLGPDDSKITDYVGRLSRHPLFTNVKLEFSRPTEAGDLIGRAFTITAQVSLDYDYRRPVSRELVTDAN